MIQYWNQTNNEQEVFFVIIAFVFIYPFFLLIADIIMAILRFMCCIIVIIRNSKRKINNEEGYKENYQQEDYQQYQNSSELQKALDFFGLQIPFSEEELKKIWKEKMKSVNPDAGGNDEDAQKVNAYFELLKKYTN